MILGLLIFLYFYSEVHNNDTVFIIDHNTRKGRKMKRSSQLTLIGMIFVWLLTTFHLLSMVTEHKISGNLSDQDHLFLQANSIRRAIQQQKEEIRNLSELLREVKISEGKVIRDPPVHQQEVRPHRPSLRHEEARRNVETDVDEFWRYMRSKLYKLRYSATGKDIELSVNNILKDGQALHRSAVNDLYALKNVDDMDKWRLNESMALGAIIQKRLNVLQHPKNCEREKLFVCVIKDNCGFGCQFHHIVYCLITGYANNRTVVMPRTHWQYAPSGWESVFQPISAPCILPVRDTENIMHPDVSSLIGVENDMHINRDYLPLAVPDDIADRLLRFHGNPPAWWIGQFVKYLLKFQPPTQKTIEDGIRRLNWTNPIVGIHVRRTDKVNHEAGKHEVEEYMSYVDAWYDQLKGRQVVHKKRVFLATDDPDVLQQVRNKYPSYDFISDQEVSKSANPQTRYQLTSLYGVLQDIILLSKCNYLVCTFSSQICRLAYELMQTHNGDASSNAQSLDDMFYFGGQTEHVMDVREPHVPREQGEIRLDLNDSVGIAGNHWDGYSKGRNKRTDTVYWTELRYDEGGRYVVCAQKSGESKFQSLTPAGFNARTRVHEYGGGAAMVYDGAVYFSNFTDQRMYIHSSTMEMPEPITEEGTFHRFADAEFHQKTGMIYCVREDHSLVEKGQDKEPKNTIVSVNPVTGSMTVLAKGADFYSSPRVAPNGKKIAWIHWHHPNMPWDSTELWIGDLNDDGSVILEGTEKQVAGGIDVSVMQPSWTAENELLYIGDQTDWWNLYHVTSTGEHVNLLPREQEIGGPQWIFGNCGYQIDPRNNGEVVTLFGQELGILNIENGRYRKLETGFKTHSFLSVAGNGTIYCVAGSPTQFPCIIRVDSTSGKVDIIRESKSLEIDRGYFSIPETISWNTTDGEVAHGYYYPPQNKDYHSPPGELPPLLVKAHGGPTAATTSSLNLKIQYFTSRGFAVLDVDYRGSTGYGKKYRHRLRKNWGIFDVEDSCSGAQSLADTGRVDKNRLCIDGSSAGGYTTLACLTFKSIFKAGASHYGIGDLEALAKDTHKFESRYLDTLISPYDEKYYHIYKERSPINHVDKLNCALALFQGDEDKIVLPNQAEMMYKAVKARGLPTMYILFKGEQHGFRKAENIQTALDGELYFFSKVFGFKAADIDVQLPIDNL